MEGPALGYGVLLQGGEVQHLASRALGVKERITTITSYCANIPGVYDSSYLTNVHRYCDRNVQYKQWVEYRLEKMKFEIETFQKQIAQSDGRLDVAKLHQLAEKQVRYMKRTARQLIPYDEYETLCDRFGKGNIKGAPKMWVKAEQLPDFTERITSVSQSNWMPGSPLWADLAETQMAIRAGTILQAQKGRYRWEKERQFSMGDELLRQGLPELFLSWLDKTGLYSLDLLDSY